MHATQLRSQTVAWIQSNFIAAAVTSGMCRLISFLIVASGGTSAARSNACRAHGERSQLAAMMSGAGGHAYMHTSFRNDEWEIAELLYYPMEAITEE